MLETGSLKLQLNARLARARPTNRLAIVGGGFPWGLMIETADFQLKHTS
jgi:hypothetical protein